MNVTPVISNETPEEAARRLTAVLLSKGYMLEGLHVYEDAKGNPIFWRIRIKHPESGDKKIWPMHIDQHGNYILKEPKFSDKKPLYKLPSILKATDNPVYVVEGEKCADTMINLGLVATTSGGCTSARSANWSPLKNRNVIIWPDNDEEGELYADDVAKELLSICSRVSIVDIKKLNLQEKDDVVNWLSVNLNAESNDIMKLPLTDIGIDKSIGDDEIINVMSQLNEISYQRQRKQAAKTLGISVASLDKLVRQHQSEFSVKTEDIFPLVEPWDGEVCLSDLLDDLEKTLNRFLVFSSDHDAKAIALWIVHTHCLEAANISPILNITSPEKRCGKSTLLAVLRRLVSRPLIASNISAAAIFRSIEKWSPTLLIDEADSFMRDNEELRGVINSGHTRDLAYTLRCVGDKHEPTRFSTWGAKVIAGIGHQADTIEDRSVRIQLRRKLTHENREQLRDAPQDLFEVLLRKCVRLSSENAKYLIESKPSVPQLLNDRSADNWTPLLAIADLASDEWSKSARVAALALSGFEVSQSMSIELLQDIKSIFEEKEIDRLWTVDLLQALYRFPEAPWATYNRGKPITDRQLASKLSDFKISSKDIRLGDKIRKGYELDDFEDTFQRYLLSSAEGNSLGVTALQGSNQSTLSNVLERNIYKMLRMETSIEAMPDAGCSGVADKSIDFATEN